MRRTFSVPTALIAFAVTLPVTVRAGDVLHLRGQAAFATFQSSDDTGCVSSYVDVRVHEIETRSLPQQPRATTMTAFLYVDQWDSCTQALLIQVAGWDVPLPEGALQVANNLGSATLNVSSLELYDYVSLSTVKVDVHLTWNPTDERPSLTWYHNSSHTPQSIYNYHSTGKMRAAQVSGTVSIGSVNYTPIPTPDGQFGTGMGGELTIYKKP